MNASPHGASVVPTVAATATRVADPAGTRGTTSPSAAAAQSGSASRPATMYAAKTVASASRTCSIRRKPPLSTRSERADRRDGHAHESVHAAKLGGGRDAGELGASRPEVRDHECRHGKRGPAHAEAVAHQPSESLAGGDARPGAELVEDDQRERRDKQDPEQRVAVVGAKDGVGGDSRRVVVREPGQHARPHDGGQRGEAASSAHAAAHRARRSGGCRAGVRRAARPARRRS